MENNVLKIAVAGNKMQVQELKGACQENVSFYNIEPGILPKIWNLYDGIFLMNSDHDSIPAEISIPVFVNEIEKTISQTGLPSSVIRVNLWPGFAANESWEIAGHMTTEHENILTKLGKKFIHLPDEPGLLSARVIAMIINEAYFAMEDAVSTAEEIDIAMKLGTNYPYGPIEWAKKIGIEKIYSLLNVMSVSNKKYESSALLKNSCT